MLTFCPVLTFNVDPNQAAYACDGEDGGAHGRNDKADLRAMSLISVS